MSSELAFFSLLVQQGSLARAARELGLTGPAVSRRLTQLEQRLGVRLLARTTRRMSLTPEGELYLAESRRILGEIEALEQALNRTRAEPRGLLRIHATFGFGRRQLAPAVSEFVHLHPAVEIQLTLSDQPVTPGEQGFDIAIRFGEPPEARVVARKIASNQRYLFASPAYLARCGQPLTLDELVNHDCIVIREGTGAFGTWTLCSRKQCRNIKVSGKLSSNHGEVAVDWALDGHGILLRSLWDTATDLRAGRLVRVLPEWSGSPADIYALYPQRLNLSAKVRVFLDFLTERFAAYRSATDSEAELPW
ncbi:MAG: transcriptional regulator, LysR family [Proteobacteria bacterium]|nr:transcriptional regulator, LysR family [Pseudomonadota bacterium]